MDDGSRPALDGTDLEILELLRQDARRTFADIAARVSLSAPAVKRRVGRLEREGVIAGYTTVVDHGKLGRELEAFTELRFAGATRVEEIAGVARGLPEVQAVFTTAGDPDALVWLRARDVADLTRVIDQLRRSGRVTGTKTLMVLDAWTAGS
jgi:Lrp/AsnC family leucine-responsive transcriptional regulator